MLINMKKIILLFILFSLLGKAQPTLIKAKQLGDGLGTGSVVVTGGANGSFTYAGVLSVNNIPNLPAYQPTITGGYLTPSNTASLSNKSGQISMWTNDSGYLTAGTIPSSIVTTIGTQSLTNKSGNVSMWTNDAAYTTTAAISNSFVPYAGATSSVNLGANSFSTGSNITGSNVVANGTQTFVGNSFFTSSINISPPAVSTGAFTTFSVNMPKNTAQTAGTEIFGWRVVGNGRQWATTAPSTQREYYFSAGTYSATALTSFVNTYGAYFDSPNLGTNVSVTGRNYAAGFNNPIHVAGGISLFQGQLLLDRGLQASTTMLSINSGTGSVNAFQYNADATNSVVCMDARNSYSICFQLNDATKMALNSTSGFSITGVRFSSNQGADVASATGSIALGSDGNKFEITGTNAITLIQSTGWQNGSEITLFFTSTASLTDGTANSGTLIGFELAGNANFTGSADDAITLILSEIGGTIRWREKCRSVN